MSVLSRPCSQCGNQVGSEFWRTLCSEHGIRKDGTLEDYATQVCAIKDAAGNDVHIGVPCLSLCNPFVLAPSCPAVADHPSLLPA